MKKRLLNLSIKTLYSLTLAVMVFGLSLQGFAQTAANTDIKNVASATYSDGTNNYSTVSNEVVVTVAKVAGLTITPDGQTNSTVVAGQTGITMTFRVTNVGNFTDDVRFLANGASLSVSGPATITAATIGGTTDIFTNGSDVLQSLAQNGFVDVTVTLSINSNAAPGSTVQVFLGDAASGTNFDNIAADSSANEVKTVSTGAVNGSREARGDISVVVDDDAIPQINLTAPTGPVALGSTITYTMEGCNVGARDLLPVTNGTLSDTQVYLYAPIPVGTELTNISNLVTNYPGVQYTTSSLSIAPLSATWANLTGATPAAGITRIRVPVGSSIAAGACATPVSFDVQITTNNANTPILEIVEIFGENSVGSVLTDQSGDTVAGKGDGNANFDEPTEGDPSSPTQGFEDKTIIQQTGGVLNGPSGTPAAVGPTNNNDDFTNKSVTTGIAGVPPGGSTTAAGTVVFTNTVQNTGNSDDTFTLTAPTVPAGFTVRISTDGGTTWVDVTSGGSTTIAVPFGTTTNYLVEVTAPAGTTVLTGYDTVIRATSGTDNTQYNDTIDRLYTGYLRLQKSASVSNTTGVGGATDAVPGAVITYTITYTNISEASAGGSVGLTVNNLVITEDGNAAPNNWGSTTTQVVGSAADSNGGTITGDSAGSSVLTDTISTLAPGATGTFTFKRTIN